MSKTYTLIIGADLPMRERAVLCTARALPAPVVLLAYPGTLLAQKRRTAFALADDVIVSPFLLDPERALQAVIEYERKTGLLPGAVIPVNDFVLPAGAAIAHYAQVPFLPNDVILRCRDKLEMKASLASVGLNVAQTLAVDREVHSYRCSGNEPVIFKPTTFGGSGAVRMVRNQAELEEALEDSTALLERYRDILFIDPSRIHLEQYLNGEREVSVEVYCSPARVTAVAVTDKMLSTEPYFAEMGHIVPYAGANNAEIQRTAEEACYALGIDRGVAHVEIKLVRDVPYVIEVGARPAGDKIIDLVYRALGVDLYALHARAYVNDWAQTVELVQRGTAAVSFMKAQPGRIEAIRAPDLLPEIREITLYKGVGDLSASEAKNFETREGHIEWFWPAATAEIPDIISETVRLTGEFFEIRPC